MDVNLLPQHLPDDLLAHLIRLAAVSRVGATAGEIRALVQEPDADACAAGMFSVMSPRERRDALDGAAARFLLPELAAHAAGLAAWRLEREFRLAVAPAGTAGGGGDVVAGSPRERLTLHEAMRAILLDQPDRTATLRLLADENKRRGLYRRPCDRAYPLRRQIAARASHYPTWFGRPARGIVKFIGPAPT